MTDLTELHARNRRWRVWMDANTPFKTPDTLDCLRYALTEAAEAMDVWLREKNQTHARNNERNHSINQELADTAMMLLTALPEVEPLMSLFSDSVPLDTTCARIAVAVCNYAIYPSGDAWIRNAEGALTDIANYPGFNLAAELKYCHFRLAWKHGKVQFKAAQVQTGSAAPWEMQA